MAESSPRTRTRARPIGQRRDLQNARVHAQLQETPDQPIVLADIFPAKEVLPVKDGNHVLPQNIAERMRYLTRYHHPEPPEVKPGKTRATRNQDQLMNPYTRDFIFQTMHQLLLTGMPMDQVALKFDVSLATAYRWRRLMMEKMADEVRKADPMPILGETLSTYRTIAAEGHRMMLSGKNAHEKRMGAEIALKALGDKQKVLQMAGFYDTPLLRMAPAGGDDPRTQGANALMDMAKAFLSDAPVSLPPPENNEHPQWSRLSVSDVDDADDKE